MKYFESWKIHQYRQRDYENLIAEGFNPLVAALLCSRKVTAPNSAREFLRDDISLLSDPYLLKDMDKAVVRIKRALSARERVAVYGDYDVDGISSTCLLTKYLRSKGLYCKAYIPERLTEGYGVTDEAITAIHDEGITLIITVDCGITAVSQVENARALSIDMIITDHHECPEELPRASAVINPRRKDCTYPFKGLAGVGVAFKLLCALEGADKIDDAINNFCDLAAIGTIADIMPVTGENRAIIRQGILRLKAGRCLGLRKLMEETCVPPQNLNSTDISFSLVPKLNAAGRMGSVRLAYDLLMSDNEYSAAQLAANLCLLNKQRREVENKIFSEAVEIVQNRLDPELPIVLASESWHHGVSGIVASRLAEKFSVPAVIICIEHGEGRGSCRSFGGFNVFDALDSASSYLNSFGGHMFAAGLTLDASNISPLTDALNLRYKQYLESAEPPSLSLDFELPDLTLLSLANMDALSLLSPWGNGNPPPLLCIFDAHLDSITPIGGDRHLKLRISKNNKSIDCLFFSVAEKDFTLRSGSLADIAFEPVVNEFRGARSVQLVLRDVRPSGSRDIALSRAFIRGEALTAAESSRLLPLRNDFARVWRCISANRDKLSALTDSSAAEISHRAGLDNPGKFYLCLSVFDELGLLSFIDANGRMSVIIKAAVKKVDLNKSSLLSALERKDSV